MFVNQSGVMEPEEFLIVFRQDEGKSNFGIFRKLIVVNFKLYTERSVFGNL